MRKYTLFGITNDIQDFAIDILKMKGHMVDIIDSDDPKKYMSKNLLIMGEVDIELLKDIVPRVRVVVYIGSDERVKEILREFAELKDMPKIISNSGIVGDVVVYHDDKKTIEYYSSLIFSELELTNKYLISNTGPKIGMLCRYLSQYFLNRNSAMFDYDNVNQLGVLYDTFVNYRNEKEDSDSKLDKDDLLQMYDLKKPK